MWTPNQAAERGAGVGPDKVTRNVFKFYEGYALVNISDAFWGRNLRCGQVFHHRNIHFYHADKV